ncbi:hypothetical protein SLEP1_g38047 [Rubroshorea leprosula]|uniref:Uncharacterized protein n=1 Tax=Rubroshorea leprosula TaxID=152421 RepID=A0AAV5KWM2_9ROSI|nr:hypothetical protein SLEP1_g38047 [Rubroshorea leprosula]
MAPARNHRPLILFLLVLILALVTPSLAQCESDTVDRKCHDKEKSLKLKIIAICSILFASAVGVCLPLLSRLAPVLHPNGNLFLLAKAFASGVILATGYMHVLPDSFNDLMSPCLPENPWRKFPFTTSWQCCRLWSDRVEKQNRDMENFGHDQSNKGHRESEQESESLMRHRVIAQVLENGAWWMHTAGIALSNVYGETSPTALIVVGILNACSAGLLNYMALVDLLASDFMGPKLQGSMKLQMRAYVAVLLGAGGMSLMAKWA